MKPDDEDKKLLEDLKNHRQVDDAGAGAGAGALSNASMESNNPLPNAASLPDDALSEDYIRTSVPGEKMEPGTPQMPSEKETMVRLSSQWYQPRKDIDPSLLELYEMAPKDQKAALDKMPDDIKAGVHAGLLRVKTAETYAQSLGTKHMKVSWDKWNNTPEPELKPLKPKK